jgi:hypothetical protein
MSIQLRLVVVFVALAVVGCKTKNKSNEVADEYADVDCEKLIAHVAPILLQQATTGQSAADVAKAEDKMKSQRPQMVAACVKEKPTKKMTHRQYDCMLAATRASDLGACQ